MKRLLILILRGYKLAISPMLGQNCRFYPSCSEYAMEAIHEYGAAKGALMAGKRLCKCHPWHPGGIDLVPPKSGSATNQAGDSIAVDLQCEQSDKNFNHGGDENLTNHPISSRQQLINQVSQSS